MADSELILLAYKRWGADCPNYLAGDFAFMIWDDGNRQLFGARDFSGSRTLYYHQEAGRFSFSTTLLALLRLPGTSLELNPLWMAEYLAHPGMIDTIEAASTVYRHVEQLPPSHSIAVTEGSVAIRRYGGPLAGERLKLKSDGEYLEAFREVFREAVEARLRTRRRVGAFLSGGLDSGAVAGFAARSLARREQRLYTYSSVPTEDFVDWTAGNRLADERPFIRSIVDYVGNIEDHYLDFSGRSAWTEADDLLDTLEMPYKFFENAYWIKGIFEAAHTGGVGVLLNGARGNFTISWGPALDYYAMLLKQWKWIRLYRELRMFSVHQGVGRSRVMKAVGGKAFPYLDIGQRGPRQEPYPQLIHPDLARATGVFDKLEACGVNLTGRSDHRFDLYRYRRQMFEQFAAWNMNGNMMTKLSLRHAMWNRDPTNDIRVIRFCLSVPEDQYVQSGMDRALIRRSTESLLPDDVRLNHRKRGIQGADGIHRMLAHWPAFMEELRQLCQDSRAAGLLNIPVIEDAMLHFRDGPRPEDAYHMKYKIMMRSLVFYRFLKKAV